MMNLPLRTRVDLVSGIRGSAVDCRLLFLGDRVRLLPRTYEEIVRRFKQFSDSNHLFESLQSSDEIKQFYEIQKTDGVVSVTLRDSIFQERGSVEDLRIEVQFRLDSNHLIHPLPLDRMIALGHLIPLLRSNRTESEIKESLRKNLNPEELDWALNLFALLSQKGFINESSLAPNRYRMEKAGSRLTFMGHSSLFFQTEKANVLTDPYIHLDDGAPEHAMDATRVKLNAIICSHSHYDHSDLQTFLWFDKDTLLIVPKVKKPTAFNPPIVEAMKMLGFRNFLEVELWKPVQIEDIELIPVPFHGEQDEPGAVMDHFTYVLRSDDLCVYAGVDSCRDTSTDMIPVLEQVREKYQPALAFLPVSNVWYRYEWGGSTGFCRYLDSMLMKEAFQYTASAEDAVECVKALKPKWVSPYAIFTFAPLATPAQVSQFEKALRNANLERHLYPLRPFQHLYASDLSESKELRRRALVRWFQIGSAIRKYDKWMMQNRIYRYLRYRGKQGRQAAEHH